jgi:hypothetical protein
MLPASAPGAGEGVRALLFTAAAFTVLGAELTARREFRMKTPEGNGRAGPPLGAGLPSPRSALDARVEARVASDLSNYLLNKKRREIGRPADGGGAGGAGPDGARAFASPLSASRWGAGERPDPGGGGLERPFPPR